MTGQASVQEKPTNERKFETGNPVVQRMIGGFFGKLTEVVEPVKPASTLDAGCGEGETISRIGHLLGSRVAAVDIESYCVETTAGKHPEAEVLQASVTELPFGDSSFELVLCLEVLEHLENPAAAIREFARVSSGDVVVSVPSEPWFQLGSLARGKYLRTFGNHPEHINHFNRRSLRALLEPELESVTISSAFPWLIARGRPRPANAAGQPG